MAKSEKQKREARRSRRTLIGAVVVLLMVLGVAFILMSTGAIVGAILDDSDERAEYEEFIAPLMQLDPLPFATPQDASQDTLVQAAIWLAFSKEDSTALERTEYGAPYLPVSVVDGWARTLFGPDYTPKHETFTDSGLEFVFDAEKQAYIIPITAQLTTYIPVVENIDNDGELKTLTVGYLLPPGSSLGNIGKENLPIKYMNYVLKRSGNSYFIYSVQESEKQPEATSQSQTTSEEVTVADEGALLDERVSEIQVENEMSESASSSSSSTSTTSADSTDTETSSSEDSSDTTEEE